MHFQVTETLNNNLLNFFASGDYFHLPEKTVMIQQAATVIRDDIVDYCKLIPHDNLWFVVMHRYERQLVRAHNDH